MSNNPSMFSIQKLFSSGEQYIIPIYQRNYAWGQSHLQQFVQDIWDSCIHSPERNYYIGMLVVHRTPKGIYETIDGQQRLTTINIMLCAMQNELESVDSPYPWFKDVNLIYQFRDMASTSLKKLYEYVDPLGIEDAYINKMYDYVKPIIENVLCQNKSNENARANTL